MVGGGERAAVADGDQGGRGGPDPDAGHRDQERGKRVGLQQGTELALQRAALVEDLGQLAGEGRDDDGGRAGAGHHDRLLGQGLGDLVG